MNNTINTASLWEILQEALLDPDFCQALGFTREQMEGQIRSCRLQEACPLLENALDDQGRFNAGVVLEIFRGFLPSLADEPPRGWLMDCYQTLLRKIFPETTEPEPAADTIRYQAGVGCCSRFSGGCTTTKSSTVPLIPGGISNCCPPVKSGRSTAPGNICGSAPWSGTCTSTNSCAWGRK